MSKYELVRDDFVKALTRLEESLALPKTDITRDSSIQRFEFTLDLAWKTAKAYLEEYRGVRCTSPKGCFREAFQEGLIDNDPFWLELVDLRNETVHTYQEAFAEQVYGQLSKAIDYFKQLADRLKATIE